MNFRLLNFRLLIGAAGIAAASLTLADNHAASEPEWSMGNPVEIYGCSFKDGIDGYQQSIKHAALVNAWAEEHDAFQNHVGQLMWPDFSDGQYPTEFTWLGYWGSYADYGADLDKRAEHGAELFVEANKFLEQCSHSEWGAWDVLPANNWTLGDHVTEFSDCFYQDGKGDADLLVANIAFAEALAARGLTGADLGVGQLWPRSGAPAGTDNPESFKWVTGYPKLSAYANYTHIWWNEGLTNEWNALYGDIVSCDSGRVYRSQVMNTPKGG